MFFCRTLGSAAFSSVPIKSPVTCPIISDVNSDPSVKEEAARFLHCKVTNFQYLLLLIFLLLVVARKIFGCGMLRSLVVVFKLLAVACGIWFPDQGSNWAPCVGSMES